MKQCTQRAGLNEGRGDKNCDFGVMGFVRLHSGTGALHDPLARHSAVWAPIKLYLCRWDTALTGCDTGGQETQIRWKYTRRAVSCICWHNISQTFTPRDRCSRWCSHTHYRCSAVLRWKRQWDADTDLLQERSDSKAHRYRFFFQLNINSSIV